MTWSPKIRQTMETDVEDMADDMPVDDPLPMPTEPGAPLPLDITAFTVDLSEAFEFRQEGDQYIWETSEDKLVEVFLKAFEDWAGVPEDESADIIDLMVEDASEAPSDIEPEDELDDWLLGNCA